MAEYYDSDKLAEILSNTKRVLDRAYLETKMKYGSVQANEAMKNYLISYDASMFTGQKTRETLKDFTYHMNEFQQVLMDYALSSYILEKEKGINSQILLEDIREYTDTSNPNLSYDPKHITAIVAIATAWSPYWTTNLLACNDKLKKALIENLINERYVEGKKKDLDNSKKVKLVKLGKRDLMLSKSRLNRDINNMNNDEEIPYFDPLVRIQDKIKERHH